MPEPMDDLVVLLPGITGSVLADKTGKIVWNATRGTVIRTLLTNGSDVRKLMLTGKDDFDADLAPDGVSAPSVIEDAHLVPGLVKIDGYTVTADTLLGAFELKECLPDDDSVGNFVKFPYDWRRDVRATARRLKRVVDRKLADWRKATANKEARVVLVAHSMGGLVSQHYLECLEGWKKARALITFGTPYRGAVQALEYVMNGYKMMHMDLSAMMRSFPSTYQLLPRYPVIATGSEVKRVREMATELGLDPALLAAHTGFHDEVDAAHERNKTIDDYNDHGYVTIPVVGVAQETLCSAIWRGGQLTTHATSPNVKGAGRKGGDGTVPQVSAIPIPQSEERDFRGYFANEQHGALQKRRSVLDDLVARLVAMQQGSLAEVRGGAGSEVGIPLGLKVDDYFAPGEPATVRVTADPPEGSEAPPIRLVVTPLDGGEPLAIEPTRVSPREFVATLPKLGAAVHRVRASGDDVLPVQALFEVGGTDAP